MPSNHLILCRPLLLPPSIFPSIRVFSNDSALRIRWPTYWSFSFSISPSNEHPGPISFRMDWLDLLAVQGTLKSLLQHHSSKASILQCSALFIVQLSYPHMTTGKTMVDGLENRIISTQLCRGDQFWPEAGGWMELWVALEGAGVGTTLSRQHCVSHSYIRVTESRRLLLLLLSRSSCVRLCVTP